MYVNYGRAEDYALLEAQVGWEGSMQQLTLVVY